MYILGIATMTESAAVLLRDGRVVAAAEEERFSRVKHQGGFPHRAIQWVLASQEITLADVEHVAVYWQPWRVQRRLRHMVEVLLTDPGLLTAHAGRATAVWSGSAVGGADDGGGWGSLFRVGAQLRRHTGRSPRRVHFLDHHACHAATAFLGSHFDQAAVLVLDGSGEAACTTSYACRGTRMEPQDRHPVPHSLGHFYSAVTGYLGFRMLDGEYRVMGLAPYGEPGGTAWMRQNFLRSVGPGRYRLERGVLDYHRALRGDFRGAFTRQFGSPRPPSETAEPEPRHLVVAASAQQAFEEVVLDMAAHLRRRTGMPALGLAGGCALNCTANGRILGEGIFDEIYVPPAPHDAGAAMGAAMLLYTRLTGRRPEPVHRARLGPAFTPAQARAAVARHPQLRAELLQNGEMARRTARTLANGGVVGWVQGAMEFGPRALGGRSYLASPLSDGIRDVMNEKIKKRELFRPFAPSVKREHASEYFALEQAAPFMSLVVPVRPEKREVIPAVTHVDGTARPQTVERDTDPEYWAVLDEFQALTGVPVVLNTSYNIQEPIVCTPDEAVATFMRSGVDALALGDLWVVRHDAAP